MTDHATTSFLQQARRNNWDRYVESRRSNARPAWDLCLLTARDECQADIYREQIEWRGAAGLLPRNMAFSVMADPQEKPVGSGGATLRALASVGWTPAADRLPAESAGGQRVLVIHSGGDAVRLPHCTVNGKLFARLPRVLPDGRVSTIFDEFMLTLSSVTPAMPAGALFVTGDVLLVFDHLQLSFQRSGVIGVSTAAPAEAGTRHGVYMREDASRLVHAYLHKAGVDELLRRGAVDASGAVQIDTGLVWVDQPTIQKWLALLAEPAVANAPVGLYRDLLMPLARETTREGYLACNGESSSAPVQAARAVIWDRLRGTLFSVERLQPAAFMHFGSSLEYWHMVTADPELAQLCGWTRRAVAWVGSDVRPREAVPHADQAGGELPLVAINAALDGPLSSTGTDRGVALVVDSHLASSFAWSGAALVSGLHTDRPLALAPDTVVHQLPCHGGYITRVFGLYDDPKCSAGEPAASYMNRPWSAWLDQAGFSADALWPDGAPSARSLWNARLFPVCADPAQSLALSIPLQDPLTAPASWPAAWLAAPRLSFAESCGLARGDQVLGEMTAVEDYVAARKFHQMVLEEQPASLAKEALGAEAHANPRRVDLVGGWLAAAPALIQLRGCQALAVATGEEEWEDSGFATLARLVAGTQLTPQTELVQHAPISCQPHRVQAAARIDFGGGWTDTPPYSIEQGGAVLNAAITLQGQFPIVAEAAWLPEPVLILESHDIDAVSEPVYVGDVLSYTNPQDPFALAKAALVLSRIFPHGCDPSVTVREHLSRLGAGLRLSTSTRIPRGSGLGTSSIMGGAVLSCLEGLLRGNAAGQQTAPAQAMLFEQVLCLEQMLTTGGGWQDQVGGLVGGIKLITSRPGLPQQIDVEAVTLPGLGSEALAARLVLVYTGQQRLAKNLLRAVMRRWMARDREMVHILQEIGRLALAMRGALGQGDLDLFGALLSEHWILNRLMDSGCTNPFIDELLCVMAPYVSGAKLAGAGGGGFVISIARDPDAARDLSDALARYYPGTAVSCWPCTIAATGLLSEQAGTV